MLHKIKSLSQSLTNYRILAILLLGFSAGIPLAITGLALNMWMARLNIDVKTIGLFALVTAPYAFKYLWSFLFDNIPILYFSKRFGFRKSWLILVQVFLMIAIMLLGMTSPLENIALTALVAFMVAFLSATQDIIIDALRIEMLESQEQALGASMYVYGYRIAMLVSGAGSLLLADYVSWNMVFFIMSLTILVGIIATIFITEPEYSKQRLKNLKKVEYAQMFKLLVIKPIMEFTTRNKWFYILIFVIFYKFSDTLLVTVQSKFYVDMGFSNTEIAYATKVLGFIMTLVGMFFGGILYYKIGTFKSLMLAAIVQILSNLVFIWVAKEQHNLLALSTAIAIENFTGAINTVVIIAYLSSLCNIAYTATQYALLSSVSSIGRTIMSAPAGYIVDSFGWSNFFWITAVAGVPALLLLFLIFKEPKNG